MSVKDRQADVVHERCGGLPVGLACIALVYALLVATPVHATLEGPPHTDPVAAVALRLVLILVTAKIGGDLATRIGQPAVLGELVLGVVLGNLSFLGIASLEPMKHDPFIDMFARIGVLVLLFQVGLESTVGQMLRVGLSSLLVATLGVVAPAVLGWGVGAWLLPAQTPYVHAFLGATLCATSVGITARVLKDLGRSNSTEARIILGAAVIDDVLGLVILTMLTAVIVAADRGGAVGPADIAWIFGKAAGLLVGALMLGVFFSHRLFALASKLRASGVLIALGLGFCFLLSWLAGVIGLAPIVGAFAAGLILEETHYKSFTDRGEHSLDELVQPIASFLVPVFFVLMGMRTNLGSFAQPGILGLAAALTVAAVIGKQACALGVIDKGVDRLTVAIGMTPRGEVGLIFANLGLGLSMHGQRLLDETTFSAIVVMVIITTLVTPPALKRRLARLEVKRKGRERPEPGRSSMDWPR